ncbi:MAG: phage portal protein [Bullifex sp.]
MLTVAELKEIIDKEKSSVFQRFARVGQNYYEGLHDIRDYRLYYYDAKGELKEDRNRTNIKISHPFFTELVDQLVQYMLSGKERYVFSDLPELQEKLDSQFNFNDDFNASLNELLTGVAIKGSEYMYLYRDEEEKLRFEVADSLGISEVRARDTADNCEYVVRWYIDRLDKDNEPIKKIEVWDKDQTTFFIEEGSKGIKIDDNVPINPRPHIISTNLKDGAMYGSSFGFIPFFRLDNNDKRKSDLSLVKELIDDYDLMSCSLSNNLQDLTEGIYVVKGFAGDNMDELIQNLKTKKIVGVDESGDIDIRTVDIPYEARKVKMELDEKNIYRFGMGFNSAQIGDGNITNIVIKSRYVLLDLKANKLEMRLKKFLRKIIKVYLDDINASEGTAYTPGDISFDFTRETITNDTDNAQIKLTESQAEQTRINTLLNISSSGTIDSETILQKMCEVLDIDYEEIKDKVPDKEEVDSALDTLGQVEMTE